MTILIKSISLNNFLSQLDDVDDRRDQVLHLAEEPLARSKTRFEFGENFEPDFGPDPVFRELFHRRVPGDDEDGDKDQAEEVRDQFLEDEKRLMQ